MRFGLESGLGEQIFCMAKEIDTYQSDSDECHGYDFPDVCFAVIITVTNGRHRHLCGEKMVFSEVKINDFSM